MQATVPEVIQHASSEAPSRRTTSPSFALTTPITAETWETERSWTP